VFCCSSQCGPGFKANRATLSPAQCTATREFADWVQPSTSGDHRRSIGFVQGFRFPRVVGDFGTCDGPGSCGYTGPRAAHTSRHADAWSNDLKRAQLRSSFFEVAHGVAGEYSQIESERHSGSRRGPPPAAEAVQARSRSTTRTDRPPAFYSGDRRFGLPPPCADGPIRRRPRLCLPAYASAALERATRTREPLLLSRGWSAR
jgi:hypothetical protein